MSKKFRFALSILTAFLFLALSGGVVQAAHVNCGDTITADTTLDANLSCTPDVDGLVIGENGVTIDLSGFTITGSGGSSGVFNPGYDEVTIMNGAITGFQDGIRADFHADNLTLKDLAFSNQKFSSIVIVNSTDVDILDVFVSLPTGGGDPIPPSGHITEAIRLANVDNGTVNNVTVDGGLFGVLSIGETKVSKGLVVEDSVFANVDTGVFIINNANAKVQNNKIVGTDYDDGCFSGIGIVGEDSSTRVHIVNNVITGCSAGIYVETALPSTKLNIKENNLNGNFEGIFLIRAQDSKLIGNNAYFNNDDGIALWHSSRNKILNNKATGNVGTDMIHGEESSNIWRGNTCVTSVGGDIDCP